MISMLEVISMLEMISMLMLPISTQMLIVSANNNFQFGQNGKEDITVADLMRHEVRLIQNCTVSKNMMITRKGQKKT